MNRALQFVKNNKNKQDFIVGHREVTLSLNFYHAECVGVIVIKFPPKYLEEYYVYNILQQILDDRLLFAVTSWQKNNFSDGFRLITCNNLPPRIYCEKVAYECSTSQITYPKKKKKKKSFLQTKPGKKVDKKAK